MIGIQQTFLSPFCGLTLLPAMSFYSSATAGRTNGQRREKKQLKNNTLYRGLLFNKINNEWKIAYAHELCASPVREPKIK